MKAVADADAMARRIVDTFTITANRYGLILVKTRRLYWRMRIGLTLIRLGAAVVGLHYEETNEPE